MSIKRYLSAFLSLLLLLSLVSCHQSDVIKGETSESESQPVSADDTEPQTSNTDTTDTEVKESPVEDFEYQVTENGEISITKYIGNQKNVVVPETINGKKVAEIGYICFCNNNDITSVVLPNSVIEIGGGAFAFCRNLEKITLPSNLEIIENGAFQNTAIFDVVFPQSLNSIGIRAFSECVNLKHISISPHVNCEDEAFAFSGLETVVIEEGVEKLAPSVFAYTNIREIVFPQSLKDVGMAAFCGCENLESITLNEGLVTIDDYAFSDAKITEIYIPRSVIQIVDNVFKSCFQLQKVKFEGNAPNNNYISGVLDMPTYTIYYHANAEGFTSPEWNGYPTEIW